LGFVLSKNNGFDWFGMKTIINPLKHLILKVYLTEQNLIISDKFEIIFRVLETVLNY
jgi:hypothetical protein